MGTVFFHFYLQHISVVDFCCHIFVVVDLKRKKNSFENNVFKIENHQTSFKIFVSCLHTCCLVTVCVCVSFNMWIIHDLFFGNVINCHRCVCICVIVFCHILLLFEFCRDFSVKSVQKLKQWANWRGKINKNKNLFVVNTWTRPCIQNTMRAKKKKKWNHVAIARETKKLSFSI